MKEENTIYKLSDVPFRENTEKSLKASHPMLRDNLTNIGCDFIKIYNDALSTENLSMEEVSQIKSDLFIAFCNGLLVGMDLTTTFRRGFNLPPEMNQANKIIMQDKTIKKPSIIL